jgi:hypothetical protein
VHITAQPVEFRDENDCLGLPSSFQRCRKLRPTIKGVITFTTLDLNELLSLRKSGNRRALSLNAQTASALLAGAHSDI